MRYKNEKYYVPKEYKSAIIREDDFVEFEEFEITRSKVFKKAVKAERNGETLKFDDYVYSANHIFYYTNKSRTGFEVNKIIKIDNDYRNDVKEGLNESFEQTNSSEFGERNGQAEHSWRNNNRDSSHARHGETSTGNVEVFTRESTNKSRTNEEVARDNRLDDIVERYTISSTSFNFHS